MDLTARAVERPSSYVLPLAFGMTVTMWGLAYLGRLPTVTAPGWLVAVAMLAAVIVWGGWTGRKTGRGWPAGAVVGIVAAMLNMLILGGLLADRAATAVWWVSGSVLLVAGLAAVSAAIGGRSGAKLADGHDWTALFSKVAVAATFLLVVAGGLVTSHEAGLAVVDWPNTFGTSMFLYPLSRMTGGIYYEHAHRLFGSLVGLTTIALAVHLWWVRERRWIRSMALLAVALVVVQGVLGGLRVTGRFTLSTEVGDMAPNLGLAVVHGVTGQLFLALLTLLAVATSRWWLDGPEPRLAASSAMDRALHLGLAAILLVQLILGAVQRHLAEGLLIHVSLAVVVTVVAVLAGMRAWGLYAGMWPLDRLGQLLASLVVVQVALGIAALAATRGLAMSGAPTPAEALVATAHQAVGAALLATAVALTVWTRRLLLAR